MTIKIKAKQTRFGSIETTQSHIENIEGRIALSIIDKHGLIAAKPDGFDETGRQKGIPMPPEEVVQRAFDIAQFAVAELQTRGWLVEIEPKDEA